MSSTVFDRPSATKELRRLIGSMPYERDQHARNIGTVPVRMGSIAIGWLLRRTSSGTQRQTQPVVLFRLYGIEGGVLLSGTRGPPVARDLTSTP